MLRRLKAEVVESPFVGDATGLMREAEATEPDVGGRATEHDAVGGQCMVPRSICWEERLVGEGTSAELERNSRRGAC